MRNTEFITAFRGQRERSSIAGSETSGFAGSDFSESEAFRSAKTGA